MDLVYPPPFSFRLLRRLPMRLLRRLSICVVVYSHTFGSVVFNMHLMKISNTKSQFSIGLARFLVHISQMM